MAFHENDIVIRTVRPLVPGDGIMRIIHISTGVSVSGIAGNKPLIQLRDELLEELESQVRELEAEQRLPDCAG